MVLEIVFLILFLIVIGFDLKSHSVPAVLTTSIILIFSIINFENIPYGIIAFVFAWLLYEFEYIEGLADVKMISAVGLMISSINSMIWFIIVLIIIGLLFNFVLSLKKGKTHYAYTVVIFATYIVLWWRGVI